MAMAKPEATGRQASDVLTASLGAEGSHWAIAVRLVREYVLPNWKLVALALGAAATSAATVGAFPFLMQKVADGVFVGKDSTLLYVLPPLIFLVSMLRAGAEWLASVTEAAIGSKVVADLRNRLFNTLALADLGWLQRNHSGRFVSAFGYDTPIVDRAAIRVLTTVIRHSLTVVVLLGAMIYMDWRLSLVALIGIPFGIYRLGRQRRRIKGSVRRSLQETGDLGSMVSQTLQSIRIVKAYGQEEAETSRFGGLTERVRKLTMRTARQRATVNPISEAVTGVGIGLAVLYGGWQGIYGGVTLGHFMGFMTAALLAFQPMRALAGAQASLTEGLTAAARVFSIIDHAARITEAPDARPLKTGKGAITFRNVTFGYEEGRDVLRDFSLSIEGGQKVALVGHSGAGKSTVLNLLLRFYDPTAGSIQIDGQDIKGVTLASLRAATALLTQEPVLFDDTVAVNIGYGSPAASREAIVAAAKAAAAHDFISAMPNGYDSRVGESGMQLSGGERQRIAFARAMLRDAPILLLDEPTSSLDAESEAKVQEAMDRLLRDRTVVMIAHRLSTVKKADMICVMHDGRIVESGTHLELVARRGAYARMFQTQFTDGEPKLFLAGA